MPPSLRKLIDSWYPGYRGTLGTRAFTLIDPVSWHGVRPATSGTDKLNKAFTLIELLITISILAILGSAISIVLNPAELLAEARDSQRINDLESLRNSLSLTLIDNPSLFDSLSNTSIYLSLPSSSCLTNPPSGYTYICNATSLNLQKTDSTGWLPLSLTNLPVFPIDPINSSSSSLYYAFVPDLTNKTFVLTSLLESEKYLKLSALKDGGTDPGRIEEGNPTLWTSASGLVGYWPMDEGTGTTTQDLSGNNNIGTLTNGPTWTASSSCKVGQCLSFDGVNDYVTMGNPGSGVLDFNLSNFTYCFWLKTTDGAGQLVGKGVWNYRAWGSYIVSGKARFEMKLENPPGNNYTADSSAINDNNWHHLCGSYNRTGNLQVYSDGLLSSSISVAGGSGYGLSTSAAFQIGFGNPGYLVGVVDDTRLYNSALTSDEVGAIYAAQK